MFWQKKTFIAGGPFTVLVLLFIGTHYDLFHTTNWYDIFMHFLGGGLLIFTLAGIVRQLQLKKKIGRFPRPAAFIAGLFIVAIVWEIIEVIFNLTPNWTQSVTDTLADIASALAGAMIALHYIFPAPVK